MWNPAMQAMQESDAAKLGAFASRFAAPQAVETGMIGNDHVAGFTVGSPAAPSLFVRLRYTSTGKQLEVNTFGSLDPALLGWLSGLAQGNTTSSLQGVTRILVTAADAKGNIDLTGEMDLQRAGYSVNHEGAGSMAPKWVFDLSPNAPRPDAALAARFATDSQELASLHQSLIKRFNDRSNAFPSANGDTPMGEIDNARLLLEFGNQGIKVTVSGGTGGARGHEGPLMENDLKQLIELGKDVLPGGENLAFDLSGSQGRRLSDVEAAASELLLQTYGFERTLEQPSLLSGLPGNLTTDGSALAQYRRYSVLKNGVEALGGQITDVRNARAEVPGLGKFQLTSDPSGQTLTASDAAQGFFREGTRRFSQLASTLGATLHFSADGIAPDGAEDLFLRADGFVRVRSPSGSYYEARAGMPESEKQKLRAQFNLVTKMGYLADQGDSGLSAKVDAQGLAVKGDFGVTFSPNDGRLSIVENDKPVDTPLMGRLEETLSSPKALNEAGVKEVWVGIDKKRGLLEGIGKLFRRLRLRRSDTDLQLPPDGRVRKILWFKRTIPNA
jgi:hypothetical protein